MRAWMRKNKKLKGICERARAGIGIYPSERLFWARRDPNGYLLFRTAPKDSGGK